MIARHLRFLKRFAESTGFTDRGVATIEQLRSRSFIGAFVANLGPGLLRAYRGNVLHFLRWAEHRNLPIDQFGAAAIISFSRHDCTTSHHWPPKNMCMTRIARFCLYLQYQGLTSSHGWSNDDIARCERFGLALLTEGVGADRAINSTTHALHFVTWLRLNGIGPDALDMAAVEAFVGHRCHCGVGARPTPAGTQMRLRRGVAATRFLRFLAGETVALENGRMRRRRAHVPTRSLPTAVRYENWLRNERGLAHCSIEAYMMDLASWLPQLGEDASCYSAADIRAVALAQMGQRSVSMQSRLVKSMRSYIGFRAQEGHCCASLCGSLISRHSYRLGSVPRHIDRAGVERVLGSCDLTRARGIRDRAILLLLAELGLRAVEIARLQLNDIDWEKAALKIRGKGGRASAMPLPQRSGDAILIYLAQARPPCDANALFIRVARPFVPFATPGEISNIAHKALARCGLKGKGGAHVFRHTLATDLLRAGGNLQEVATVLRHQSLDTTAIYAKVDERMLRGIAMPWPGARNA